MTVFTTKINHTSVHHQNAPTDVLLTYDNVRLAGCSLSLSAGICCEVALDLISSLIEQVQVVFHWVSIVEALAETNDTWRGRKTGTLNTLHWAHL